MASSLVTMETETCSASRHSRSQPVNEYLKDFDAEVNAGEGGKIQTFFP